MRLDSPRVTLAAAAGLAFLLVILATLQYRWLDQVAEADRDRARASLAVAASGFAADFDREIGHVIACFEPGPLGGEPSPETLAGLWQSCVARSGLQGVVAGIYVAELTDDALALSRLDFAVERFEPVAWPEELSTIRRRLLNASRPDGSGLSRSERFIAPIEPDVPAIILPRRVFRGASSPEPPGGPTRFTIIRLDLAELRQSVFPDLARRYFGTGNLQDYELAVIRRGDPSRPIYVSGPGGRALPGAGDATAELLTFRIFQEVHRSEHLGRHALPSRGPDFPPPELHSRAGPFREWRSLSRDPGDRRSSVGWRLVVAHREGSLDAAVARVRRRNLGVGLGILGVLAGAVAMTVVSARRAQRLARQQIDFVAAVSHELHTPLAAIRSAGQNLADGVVSEGGQVRRYGSLIESEGRRLSEMVTHVLDFSGIQSGRRHYRMRPVSVEKIVDGVLGECRWAAEQRGIRIEREIAADLPLVLADQEALGRALRNLIDNAIKYGGAERWMRVRAERVCPNSPLAGDLAVPRIPLAANGDHPEVAISVEDRGPGVRNAESNRIFEPFYRGEGSASSGVTGSGLGLALVRPIVEAHGGTITVESNVGSAGARFVLRLPAAPAGPAGEGLSS
jgi:two-component system, OmpR family, sensor histidine kinase SenX3